MLLREWSRRSLGFKKEVEAQSCSRGLPRTARRPPSRGQRVCRAHPHRPGRSCVSRSRRRSVSEVAYGEAVTSEVVAGRVLCRRSLAAERSSAAA